MKTLVAGIVSAACLYGAPGDSQSVLGEVAKLRAKYEECRESQAQSESQKVKGYQTRIARLEAQIREHEVQLKRHIRKLSETELELSRKKGVIRSLEKTLTSRDAEYREAVARNERLAREAGAVKVGKIERENLTRSLAKAKEDIARLQKELKKGSPAGTHAELASAQAQIAKLKTELAAMQSVRTPSADTEKLRGVQEELRIARAEIAALKSVPPKESIREKTVEKVVYRDRPVIQEKVVEKVVYRDRPVEKVVTKTVEPTEKLKALQNELASARLMIEKLRNTPSAKEKIVEKVVYKDRIVIQEKIVEKPVEKVVYKERPVIQEKVVEKVVYRDRPVEKVVTKTVEPVEKLRTLEAKLARAEGEIAALKAQRAPSPGRQAVATAQPQEMRAVRSSGSVAAKKAEQPAPLSKKTTGASAYRMAADAPIFNAPGGSVIDRWEARRSFTAGAPSGGWIRITGYFVNRVWQPAGEDEHLWVRESDVIRR